MKNLRLPLSALLVLFLLGGCATTGATPGAGAANAAATLPPVAGTQDAHIADLTARELDRRARYDPDSLAAVSPQLRALALAMAGPVEAPTGGRPTGGDLLAPAPDDMLSAPSLWHGIHLASYRIAANAVAGWDELQARFPAVLAGREARIEAVTIPDRGDYLRLQAGPYDTLAAARAACRVIEQAGEYCMPVDFSGRPLADILPVPTH